MQQNVEMDSISSRLGKTTIELEHISKGFGDKHLINDFSYIVLRDDRIGFIGPNGCGKSTLMKMIMGILKPDEGNITIGDTVKIGYFAQENEDMTGDIRVIDYIRNVAEYIQTTKGQASASQMLDRFLFPPELQYTPLDKLSGGEQRRLYLLKVLMEAPNVLILDEPTNHLDIFMRETLTDALSAYTGTLLLVTHDRYLMQTLGCPILYLEDGKATFYQNFQKLHDRDTSKQPEPAKQEDKPQKAGYGKEQRRRRAEVRTRLKALETEIEELGAHIVELENEINDPEVLRDHLLLRDKCDELDDSRFHQQELYDEWEKLAEEQDRMDAESDS